MRILLAALAAALALLGCESGSPAPDVSFVPLNDPGKKTSLKEFEGKVVLIDFWATWCSPCHESMPMVQRLRDKHIGDGLEVLAVTDEDAKRVESFIRESPLTLSIYLDPDARAMRKLDVMKLPHSVLVNRKGRIVWQGNPLHFDELERAVESALKS